MHYLVHNPAAGRGRAAWALPRVLALCDAAGLEVTVLTTREAGHATRLVRQLAADARVLCLGGDGTVHEVALACVDSERTLGVLPVGSGNDFAFALGLPHHDLARALRAAIEGRVVRVDSGRVNGVIFVNALGVGFDAEVAQHVSAAPAPLRGLAAYLYAVFITLRKLRNVAVEVVVDGSSVFRGPSLLVSVLNGPRTGGGFLFAPHARPDDGLLEVLIAGSFGRLGTLAIIPRVMRGRHLGHPQVFAFQGRKVSLHWAEPRPAHLDGEMLEPTATFEITVQPGSLRVFAPE